MNYLNLIKKEIKNKRSTRLLLGVLALIVCGALMSTIMLKKAYDAAKNKPKNPLEGYIERINQPFKHINVQNTALKNAINFSSDKHLSFSVSILKTPDVDAKDLSDYIFIKNDTLYITQNRNALKISDDLLPPVMISAPQIETIALSNSGLSIRSLNQKSIIINLTNSSALYLDNAIKNLDSCKLTMTEHSLFGINYSNAPKNINIQTFEANLSGNCQLQLANACIKNFKLNAQNNNQIQLSSETLQGLIK